MRSFQTLSFFFFALIIAISISLKAFANNTKALDVCPARGNISTTDLPTGYNMLFAGSGECIMCHNSMVDGYDNDISVTGWWRSSMMANSTKDPFWRAKISYESIKNPPLTDEIETTCLRCHAPMGVFNAFHNGQTHYSLNDLDTDPIANDGVSCTVCHQIKDESLGNYSGNIEFGTAHQIWGPYRDMVTNPMISHTGYTPLQGLQIKDSELCASCHTLLTPSIDLDGQPTGTYFVEQAIYQEWENSESFEMDVSCQDCHLPEIEEPVVISSMPAGLIGHSPFGLHELVGANVMMLNILKANAEELGITAGSEKMDATINRTLKKLQQESINLSVEVVNRDDDSIYVDVRLQNLAGHKVPAGYPSRQVYIEFIAYNENNEIIFSSGQMDENYNLIGENEDYEPHHQMINSEEDVQIYQLVMGDIENNVTTTLLHAHHPIKDNRLPPKGFSISHPSYDTIEIVGNAYADPSFNPNNQGGDLIKYHIPIGDEVGQVEIEVKVFYQTVNNKWLQDMFAENSADINSFHAMYEAADKTPTLMQGKSVISYGTNTNDLNSEFSIYPNPTRGTIFISENNLWTSVKIFQSNGKFIREEHLLPRINTKLNLPETKGVYFLQFENNSHASKTIKVLNW